jgi:hypothetical protein
MTVYRIGPVIAGRILAETGDVARFATKDKFASSRATAPIDVSSSGQVRHRWLMSCLSAWYRSSSAPASDSSATTPPRRYCGTTPGRPGDQVMHLRYRVRKPQIRERTISGVHDKDQDDFVRGL